MAWLLWQDTWSPLLGTGENKGINFTERCEDSKNALWLPEKESLNKAMGNSGWIHAKTKINPTHSTQHNKKKERKRPLLNEDRSLVSVVNYQEIIKLGEARLHEKTSRICQQELYLLFSCPLHICPPRLLVKVDFRSQS